MASNYPGSLDSFDTIASDKKTSDSVGGRTHRQMHNDLGDAIEAVQTELGTDPAGASATVKARFDVIEANEWVTTARIDGEAVTAAKLAAGLAPRLPEWRAALASALTGGKARVSCVGDSWTFGFAATDKWEDGFPNLLRRKLNQIAPTRQGIILPSWNAINDPGRSFITVGSGWTTSAGYGPAAIGMLSAPAGTSAATSFGPFWCSGFIVYYMRRSNTGTFDIQIDSETAVNVGGTGADAIVSSTVMASSTGSHTLNVKNVATNNVIIMGVEPITGAAPGTGVYLSEAGAPGSKVADWDDTSAPWAAGQQIWTTHAPDLTIITLGINDQINDTVPATFKTRYDSLVQTARGSGSVLCVVQAGATADTYAYDWRAYADAIHEVAADQGASVCDLRGLWGGDIDAQSGVYDSGDNIHPNDAGHAAIADALFNAVGLS